MIMTENKVQVCISRITILEFDSDTVIIRLFLIRASFHYEIDQSKFFVIIMLTYLNA